MRTTIRNENIAHGTNEELNELTDQLCSKAMPRLLRPLEAGGRSIKPSLILEDLWQGNVDIDMGTDKPILFDASAMYAYNEC